MSQIQPIFCRVPLDSRVIAVQGKGSYQDHCTDAMKLTCQCQQLEHQILHLQLPLLTAGDLSDQDQNGSANIYTHRMGALLHMDIFTKHKQALHV